MSQPAHSSKGHHCFYKHDKVPDPNASIAGQRDGFSALPFSSPSLYLHVDPRIREMSERLDVLVSAVWTREGTGLIWLRNSGY